MNAHGPAAPPGPLVTLATPTGHGEIDAAVRRFADSLSPSDPFVVGIADAVLPVAISDPTLPDNPIIYVNAAFEGLTGYPASDVVGRNCRFLQGPRTSPDDVASLREAIAARRRVALDLLNYRRDGSPFWNRLMVTPVFGPDGPAAGPRYFFASQLDVTIEHGRVAELEAEQRGLLSEFERIRREILDTEARLDLALQTGQLGTWALDPATRQLDASAGCKKAFGLGPADEFGYEEFLALVHPDDRERVVAAIADTVDHGTPYDVEYRIVTPANERRWVAVRGTLLTRRDGSPLTMTGFVTDISARKDAEEHKALLAGELSHRVKNTLATVGAVVNQSLRNATSLTEARDAISGRIASLATAHDLLLGEEMDGAAVSDIVRGAVRTFDDPAGTVFTVEGPDLRLEPRITLALSMALHELATNAAKYGALSVPGGHVLVRWQLGNAENGHRRFDFLWQESGGPTVSPPTRTGFGSRMIDRMMAKHMRGTATTTYPPGGVEFRLRAML